MKFLFCACFFLLCHHVGFSQMEEMEDDTLYSTAYIEKGFLSVTQGWFLPRKVGSLPFNSNRSFDFRQPIRNIGIEISTQYGDSVNHDDVFLQSILFGPLLPQSITLGQDSIHARLNGSFFSFGIGADFLPRSKHWSINFGVEFNLGRLKISSSEFRSKKNPFFCPALFVQPNFRYGFLSISTSISYQYDVSKPGWKNVLLSRTNGDYDLDAIKLTGFAFQLGIGLNLAWDGLMPERN